MADGADLLDVGGVKAGPGPEVGEAEELDRVIPAIGALRARFDTPLSVDTGGPVAAEAYAAGAVVGNDISGFADPGYLPAAAAAGASVVATHIRLGPRVPDPDPVYDDVVETVAAYLVERGSWRGRGPDPRSDHGRCRTGPRKDRHQSLTLLRASDRLAGLGYPLLLSASNKTFLGKVLDLEIDQRWAASMSATALGAALGCRIMRVHDVAAHRQVCSVMASIGLPWHGHHRRRRRPNGHPWLRWPGSADGPMSAAEDGRGHRHHVVGDSGPARLPGEGR